MTSAEVPVQSESVPTPQPTLRASLRVLLAIAAPIVMSTAAETMLNFADYAIVSQLGPEAQAGVQSGTMAFFTVYSLLLGVMLVVTTMVSQSFGANRSADCSAYAWQGVWLCGLFGIAALAFWPLIPGLFAWFGHAPGVQAMEVEYTRIRLLGLGAAGACLAIGNFFNGIQQPGRNTISVLIANAVNIPLSYGLTLGTWGFPQMGVAGAAWGSVIATVVRLAYLLAVMCYGRSVQQYAPRRTWAWSPEKMLRLVRVGWPSGVTLGLDITAWALFMTWIIGRFGTAHLAASATCWRYTELSFMPALGIGFAVSTLVGSAIGEGRPALARRWTAVGMGVSMLYMGAMGLVFLLFGRSLMDVFSDDPVVIKLGAQLLVLAAMFQLFDAGCLTYSNALRGAGDTLWPMVVGPSLGWALIIGGSLITSHVWPELGSVGPWCCATLHVIVLGLVLWVRWRRGAWEKLDVIGRTPGATEPARIAAGTALMDPAVPETG